MLKIDHGHDEAMIQSLMLVHCKTIAFGFFFHDQTSSTPKIYWQVALSVLIQS